MHRRHLLIGAMLSPSLVLPAWCAENITVSAAASLKVAFSKLVNQFERENPGIKVTMNYASSSQLASQIAQGAPVDVFASADRKNVGELSAKGFIRQSAVFTHNKLVAIASKTSGAVPGDSLAFLAKPGLRIIMPSPKIPAAMYVSAFLLKADKQKLADGQFSAKIRSNTVSEEPDIRMVAMKVAMGEGDAGLVYATDVTPDIQERLTVIPIPDTLNVRADYVVGLVAAQGAKAAAAKRFFDYLLAPKGQGVLVAAGFESGR